MQPPDAGCKKILEMEVVMLALLAKASHHSSNILALYHFTKRRRSLLSGKPTVDTNIARLVLYSHCLRHFVGPGSEDIDRDRGRYLLISEKASALRAIW